EGARGGGARAEAEATSHRVARLQAFTAALGEASRAGHVVDVVVREGLAAMDARAAAVYRLTEDGAAFEVLGSIGYPESVWEKWRRFPAAAPGLANEALAANGVVGVEGRGGVGEPWPDQARA